MRSLAGSPLYVTFPSRVELTISKLLVPFTFPRKLIRFVNSADPTSIEMAGLSKVNGTLSGTGAVHVTVTVAVGAPTGKNTITLVDGFPLDCAGMNSSTFVAP